MTLMLLESLCVNVLAKIEVDSPALHRTLDCLESVVACLLVRAAKVEASSQSEMPYSQQHREKLRVWQALIVLMQLLENHGERSPYTKEFRERRKAESGRDIVAMIDEQLWKSIQQS